VDYTVQFRIGEALLLALSLLAPQGDTQRADAMAWGRAGVRRKRHPTEKPYSVLQQGIFVR
jgi:hypothetical protein